ncbi:MAG: adenosylmethionine decarboxylase [Anaerolineales bacterium]
MLELKDCDRERLNDLDFLQSAMLTAAEDCGATVLGTSFHPFQPQGVSGVVVIAESHLAIHTWPEYGYAAVDVFTCGDSVDPWIATKVLQEYLGAESIKTVELNRGELANYKVLRHKPVEAKSI